MFLHFLQLENSLNNIFIYEDSVFLRMGIFIFLPNHSFKGEQEAAGFKICAPEHAQKNETNLP